ncbi:hypothetical protein [Polaribacter sp. R77954]|uniref:GT-D fold domain-containing protein n=1 Tax=Polaribacter sp. R77954 TaxID=3093870 RepID=UPI0037CB5643
MIVLKILRKIYTTYISKPKKEKPICIQDPNEASKLIYDSLVSDEPCMIARFGSTELSCLSNYLGVHSQKNQYFSYIKGKTNAWWWEKNILNQMQQWSGFFPPTVEKIEQFCDLMLADMKEVDILGSWLSEEKDFEKQIGKAQKVRLVYLEPFWTTMSWTKALEGKKVLVIHPFNETIEQQYPKRNLIFPNGLLPQFELKTIQAVQSLGGINKNYKDWFEALDSMKKQIDETDFDICIIGAGAYGFPLAAHIKRLGKKAFHLGGSSQLLFGIKGKRWESTDYGKALNLNYPSLFNEYWVKPGAKEKPKTSDQVEDNCYW